MSQAAATAGRQPTLAELERDEPILEFLLLKGMDYGRRATLTVVLAAAGLALQVVLLSVWVGLPLLLAALLLSWVVGFDNRTTKTAYRGGAAWEPAPFAQLDEIVQLDRRMRTWDQSAFDLTSGPGCGLLLLAVVSVGLVTFLLSTASTAIGLIFGVDAALLLLFQWGNGMRTVHRQPALIQKAQALLATAEALATNPPAGAEVAAQLLMAGGGDHSDIPTDARITVQWPGGPSHFYGVQGQVVLNDVQGKKHPYFYAVLVAGEGHGLIDHTAGMELPAGVLRETQHKDRVEVVIVRQRTTKKAGYHTAPAVSRAILYAAIDAARDYVAAST